MTKASLRQQLMSQRRCLSVDSYCQQSQQVKNIVSGKQCFLEAQTIALYSPICGEVDILNIFEDAKKRGKSICFPRVVSSDLQFSEVSSLEDLVPGAFGVLEPAHHLPSLVDSIDLMFVPGVGFDLQGNRLGYGKGFYDRWLAANRPKTTIGLAFDFQVLACLPTETHDQRMNFIATETRFIPCHNGVAGSI